MESPRTPKLGLRAIPPGWNDHYKLRLGLKIRQLREGAGMTRRELAEKSGVAQATIRSWERGVAAPREAASAKLANGLGMDLEALRQKLR